MIAQTLAGVTDATVIPNDWTPLVATPTLDPVTDLPTGIFVTNPLIPASTAIERTVDSNGAIRFTNAAALDTGFSVYQGADGVYHANNIIDINLLTQTGFDNGDQLFTTLQSPFLPYDYQVDEFGNLVFEQK
jgi:hypothetical protein